MDTLEKEETEEASIRRKSMSKDEVAIIVDSTAYLPAELITEYNLHVIPLYLNWAGESLRDNVDITPEEFYKRLQEAKEMPTTSQPSAGEFVELFSRVAEAADSIVGVFISSELSGTVASAHAAAEMMEDTPIEIVDSYSASMGLGYITLAAARAVANGADHAAAATAARALVPQTQLLFMVDTLEFLHRGGRIGGARRFVGSMLSIKPVLHLVEGRIEPLASVRTKRKAIQHMLDKAAEEMSHKHDIHAAVIHAAAEQEANRLRDEVKELLDPVELLVAEISPVIGAHAGPGAVGLIYHAGS
jgi:DegV family protein with EDD domain